MAMFAALAGVSPDFDIPLALLGHEVWFKWHQVFTHSLVGLLWIPLALSLIPWQFASWRTRYIVALAGWFLHIVLDLVAHWPVPVFWPLTDARWYFPLISSDFSLIVDMLLITGLAVTFLDTAQKHARWISISTATIVAVWLIVGLPT